MTAIPSFCPFVSPFVSLPDSCLLPPLLLCFPTLGSLGVLTWQPVLLVPCWTGASLQTDGECAPKSNTAVCTSSGKNFPTTLLCPCWRNFFPLKHSLKAFSERGSSCPTALAQSFLQACCAEVGQWYRPIPSRLLPCFLLVSRTSSAPRPLECSALSRTPGECAPYYMSASTSRAAAEQLPRGQAPSAPMSQYTAASPTAPPPPVFLQAPRWP